ncbi:MAG: hypothetical protein R3344_11905, partial [Acidobacteriota bacterium]|nr:hypothetical protein [Acidobacteriota bacterium]
MKTRKSSYLVAVVLLITGVGILKAGSADHTGGESVGLMLRVLCTRVTDGVFQETRQCASSSVAENGAAFLAVGRFGVDGPDATNLLVMAIGTGDVASKEKTVEKWLEESPNFWWVEFERVGSEIGTIEVDVTWTRYHADAPGEAEIVTRETRRIAFGESSRHVLDLVAAAPPFWPCSNIIIELAPTLAEDPQFADARLGYELWYRHTDSEGRAAKSRLELSGSQGEKIDFG